MPRPNLSIVLLDPDRFAAVLQEMRGVGAALRDAISNPYSPYASGPVEALSVRDFAPLVGLSVPGVFALLHGRRRHLRLRSATHILEYLSSLCREPTRLPAIRVLESFAYGRVSKAALPDLTREAGFGSEDDLFAAMVVAIKARLATEKLRASLFACVEETWVLPPKVNLSAWAADLQPEQQNARSRFALAQVLRWFGELDGHRAEVGAKPTLDETDLETDMFSLHRLYVR